MLPPPPKLQQLNRTLVRHQGRALTYFSGCDYFRLSSHPHIIQAVQSGLRQFGLNVAASRATTGNHPLYEELELQISRFFGAPAATLLSSGYNANLCLGQALAGNFTHAFIDQRAHGSVRDAARFLRCPITDFKHRDVANLAGKLRSCPKSARIILLTDGMFAHDGSIAPLKDYLQLLPPTAVLVVDDAHAAGLLGPTGQGTHEHLNLSRRRIIQTVTFSKAFGIYGGAILGTRALRNQIKTQTNFFPGNTPLPLPLAYAVLQALKIVQCTPGLRRRLHRKSLATKTSLKKAGIQIPDHPGPIISVSPSHPQKIKTLKQRLLSASIYPPLIHYPGGPDSGYFRFALSSEHSSEQLANLVSALLQPVSL